MIRRLALIPAAGAVLAAVLLGGCSATDDSASDPGSEQATTPTPTPTPTPEKASPTPEGPKTSFGPGKYKVGEDIAAGSYRTAGPEDDSFPNCYWAREKDDSGSLDSIIANANSEGPTRVTVNAGEFFETSGCQTWHKV